MAEAAAGIELISRDPNAGENETWIPSELYESATPAHWDADDKAIAYFRRVGADSRLVVQRELFEESEVLKRLRREAEGRGDENGVGGEDEVNDASSPSTPIQIHPLDLHIRTDGLYLYSRALSLGLRIPMDSIATYAPDKIQLSPSSPSSTPSAALRLDMIPPDPPETYPDGYSPSILYHIVPALLPSDDEIPQTARDMNSSCPAALQAMIKAVTCCQEHLPVEEDEGMGVMLGGGGVSAYTAGGQVDGVGGGSSDDVVRIRGLENFNGWVTAENVEEVMRANGMEMDGVVQDGAGVTFLGPGAGARRQREDGDEEGDEEERVIVWQRTED